MEHDLHDNHRHEQYGPHPFTEGNSPNEYHPILRANAHASFMFAHSNSSMYNISGGGTLYYRDRGNKLIVDVGANFGWATVTVGVDRDGTKTIDGEDEIVKETQPVTALWYGTLRYYWFFTQSNAFYLSGIAMGDRPAGKKFIGGGQLGYARRLYKNDTHELSLEGGYDFHYEVFEAPDIPGRPLHAARLALAYGVMLKNLTLVSSLDSFLNLVPEHSPGHGHESEVIGPLQAVRLIGRLTLNTQVHDRVGLRIGVHVRYDSHPSPMAPLGLAYGPAFNPLADELDVLTDASVVFKIF